MKNQFLALSLCVASLLAQGAFAGNNSAASMTAPSEPSSLQPEQAASEASINNNFPGPGVATVLPQKKGFEKTTMVAAKKKKKKSKVGLSNRHKKSTLAKAAGKSSAGL